MTNGYEAESDDSINDRIDDTQDTMQWLVASAGRNIYRDCWLRVFLWRAKPDFRFWGREHKRLS